MFAWGMASHSSAIANWLGWIGFSPHRSSPTTKCWSVLPTAADMNIIAYTSTSPGQTPVGNASLPFSGGTIATHRGLRRVTLPLVPGGWENTDLANIRGHPSSGLSCGNDCVWRRFSDDLGSHHGRLSLVVLRANIWQLILRMPWRIRQVTLTRGGYIIYWVHFLLLILFQ